MAHISTYSSLTLQTYKYIPFSTQVIGQPSPAKESGLASLIKHEVPVKHRLEVHYRDLSACEKPQYLPELEAHCWGECKYGLQCSSPATYKDVLANRSVTKVSLNHFTWWFTTMFADCVSPNITNLLLFLTGMSEFLSLPCLCYDVGKLYILCGNFRSILVTWKNCWHGVC